MATGLVIEIQASTSRNIQFLCLTKKYNFKVNRGPAEKVSHMLRGASDGQRLGFSEIPTLFFSSMKKRKFILRE